MGSASHRLSLVLWEGRHKFKKCALMKVQLLHQELLWHVVHNTSNNVKPGSVSSEND